MEFEKIIKLLLVICCVMCSYSYVCTSGCAQKLRPQQLYGADKQRQNELRTQQTCVQLTGCTNNLQNTQRKFYNHLAPKQGVILKQITERKTFNTVFGATQPKSVLSITELLSIDGSNALRFKVNKAGEVFCTNLLNVLDVKPFLEKAKNFLQTARSISSKK
jgi:hypothetical protein